MAKTNEIKSENNVETSEFSDFNEYQKTIVKTDLTEVGEPGQVSMGMVEKILGLSGEAGEVADKIKKIVRDKGGQISEEDKAEVVKELGDVLWYVATAARYLGVPFSEVARVNVRKMESRFKRGKLSGSGDNR